MTDDRNGSHSYTFSDSRLNYVVEEVGKAQDEGKPVDVDSLVAKSPELEKQIRALVADMELGQENVAAAYETTSLEAVDVASVDTVLATSKYTHLREHDAGGFGKLMKGRDEQIGRDVAIKVLPKERMADAEIRERFVREAEVTGKLHHPGVVPVYCRGETSDDRPFYVMPFLEDGSLSQSIDSFHQDTKGRYDSNDRVFRELLGRFVSACRTIAYAHNRGIVHRDIKPQNIMLGRFGETLVIDWGLAEAAERDDHHRQSGEQTVHFRGGTSSSGGGYTPQYASPEQMQDGEVTPLSDVYSLGATLYKLITGTAPIRESTFGAIRTAAINGSYDSPRERNPSVPKTLDAICRKAMSREPADRYQTPLKLADDIEAYLADEPIVALPDTRVTKLLRRMRRQVSSVIGTIAALLLLIGVLVFAAVSRGRLSHQLAESASDRLTLAANLAARVGGAEIDRRWLMLERDAENTQLVELVSKLNEQYLNSSLAEPSQSEVAVALKGETLDQLKALMADTAVDKYLNPERTVPVASYFVVLRNGTLACRVPHSNASVFGNYAYRAYFHGQPNDLDESASAPVSDQPVLSPVFISTSTGRPHIALSVPIWSGDRASVLGRLVMSVEVGQLKLFTELGENEIPMLVESRDYDVGEITSTGLIADHPDMSGVDVSASKMPHVSVEGLTGLREPRRIQDFRDPITGYMGDAVAAPVVIPGRPAQESVSGWVMILHPAN